MILALPLSQTSCSWRTTLTTLPNLPQISGSPLVSRKQYVQPRNGSGGSGRPGGSGGSVGQAGRAGIGSHPWIPGYGGYVAAPMRRTYERPMWAPDILRSRVRGGSVPHVTRPACSLSPHTIFSTNRLDPIWRGQKCLRQSLPFHCVSRPAHS